MKTKQQHRIFLTKSAISIAVLFVLTSACNSKTKKSFDENGNLTSILAYDDDKKLDGVCQWFYSDGKLQLKAEYLHGIAHGIQERYYENGKIQETANFKQGLKDSISLHYDLNGQLVIREFYINDSLHGPYQRWYETGQIAIEGNYVHGLMDGLWLFYDQDSDIIGKGDFVKGSGIQKIFFPNGKVQRQIRFQNNLKHGDEEFFDEQGKVVQLIRYQHGTREMETFAP